MATSPSASGAVQRPGVSSACVLTWRLRVDYASQQRQHHRGDRQHPWPHHRRAGWERSKRTSEEARATSSGEGRKGAGNSGRGREGRKEQHDQGSA